MDRSVDQSNGNGPNMDPMSKEPLLAQSKLVDVDPATETAQWFCKKGLLADHEKLLKTKGMPGNFVVHEVIDDHCAGGQFWLSYINNEEGQLSTVKIARHSTVDDVIDYSLEGGTETFPTISNLVDHYTKASNVAPLTRRLQVVSSDNTSMSAPAKRRGALNKDQDELDTVNEASADLELDLSHLGQIKSAEPLDVDRKTLGSSWFTSKMDREVVKAMVKSILMDGVAGNFIVRDKASDAGSFALSVNSGTGQLLTFLIETRGKKRRVALLGTVNETFDTIFELVEFYSQELRFTLGVKLVSPGDYLDQARDDAVHTLEQTRANGSRIAAKKAGAGTNGLPAWLRVDEEIKDHIPQEMRDRVDPSREYEGLNKNTSPRAVALETSIRRRSATEVEVVVKSREADGLIYDLATRECDLNTEGTAPEEAMYDFATTDRAYDLLGDNESVIERQALEGTESESVYTMASAKDDLTTESGYTNQAFDGGETYDNMPSPLGITPFATERAASRNSTLSRLSFDDQPTAPCAHPKPKRRSPSDADGPRVVDARSGKSEKKRLWTWKKSPRKKGSTCSTISAAYKTTL